MNAKALGLVAVTLVLLTGLFVLLRPAPPAAPSVQAAGVPAKPAAPAAPASLRVELNIQDGRLVSGPAVIAATQGQSLQLRVNSNRADELHLHGYDRTLKLAAGVPAELSLELGLSGRFEVELHHAHAALAVLEVQPQAR